MKIKKSKDGKKVIRSFDSDGEMMDYLSREKRRAEIRAMTANSGADEKSHKERAEGFRKLLSFFERRYL